MLSLFWGKLLLQGILRIKLLRFQYAVVLTIILIGLFFSLNHINLPLGINQAFVGLFFMFCGNQYKKIKDRGVVFLFSFCIYFGLTFIFHPTIDIHTNYYGTNWLHAVIVILSSVSGIVVLEKLFRRIKFHSCLIAVGRDSMSYYVLHWIILMFISQLFQICHISLEKSYWIVCSIMLLIILPLANLYFKKYCPFLLGIKK